MRILLLTRSSPRPAPLLKRPDYVLLKERERIAKEEADKKKAEEAAKKAEEKKKKDEEKRLEAEKKAEEERLAEEARKAAKILPDINFSCLDVLFRPVEDTMDGFLGNTLDPLGQGVGGIKQTVGRNFKTQQTFMNTKQRLTEYFTHPKSNLIENYFLTKFKLKLCASFSI